MMQVIIFKNNYVQDQKTQRFERLNLSLVKFIIHKRTTQKTKTRDKNGGHTCNVLEKLCNLIWKMFSENVKPPWKKLK